MTSGYGGYRYGFGGVFDPKVGPFLIDMGFTDLKTLILSPKLLFYGGNTSFKYFLFAFG